MTGIDRRQIVARQIAEVIRTQGYDGASMAMISTATGLKKSSLYHYFPKGKEDMAEAAMGALGQEANSAFFAPLETDLSPRDRLTAFTEGLLTFYKNGESNCILATMTMTSGTASLNTHVKDAFDAWIAAIALMLRDAGFSEDIAQSRARAAVERIQGSLIVSRALGDTEGFRKAILDLPDQLLAETDATDNTN